MGLYQPEKKNPLGRSRAYVASQYLNLRAEMLSLDSSLVNNNRFTVFVPVGCGLDGVYDRIIILREPKSTFRRT